MKNDVPFQAAPLGVPVRVLFICEYRWVIGLKRPEVNFGVGGFGFALALVITTKKFAPSHAIPPF